MAARSAVNVNRLTPDTALAWREGAWPWWGPRLVAAPAHRTNMRCAPHWPYSVASTQKSG